MKTKYLIFILFSTLLNNSAYTQESKEASIIIKVLSFNIYHGETMNHDFDLDKIAQVIIDSNADLVALQEVDFKTNRAKKYDLVTELAWRCKMQGIFGKAMDYDGGEYGEGILSRWSFFQTHNHALPYTDNNEARAALESIIILASGDTISFIGTHFDHLENPTDRMKQAKQMNIIFRDMKYPSILAGDLNDIPGSEAIQVLENIWSPTYTSSHPIPTYPAYNPETKIDYIMYAPSNKWKVIESKSICDTIASDHCAYFVSLELLN